MDFCISSSFPLQRRARSPKLSANGSIRNLELSPLASKSHRIGFLLGRSFGNRNGKTDSANTSSPRRNGFLLCHFPLFRVLSLYPGSILQSVCRGPAPVSLTQSFPNGDRFFGNRKSCNLEWVGWQFPRSRKILKYSNERNFSSLL